MCLDPELYGTVYLLFLPSCLAQIVLFVFCVVVVLCNCIAERVGKATTQQQHVRVFITVVVIGRILHT